MKTALFSVTSKIAFCFILTIMSNLVFAQVVYVTPVGAGLMDGSSWNNAIAGNFPSMNGYTKLADTLKHANAGAIFWIKEGTYKTCGDNDREKSFELGQNIRLYGGFAGTETDTLQRNLALHTTVFSGDIGVLGDSTDNTKIILIAGSPYALIDGIYFLNSYNNSSSYDAIGTGIYNTGLLAVKRCRFENNFSGSDAGAGICNKGTIHVDNCLFFNNISGSGGGLYNQSIAIVTSSRFSNNKAYNNGGGIYHVNGTLTVINCLIVNNQAYNGAGICSWYGVVTNIINTTIAANTSNLVIFWGQATIQNSIIWGGAPGFSSNPSLNISHSIIQDYTGNPTVLNQDPAFNNPLFTYNPNQNGLSADWTLQWCSPGFDAGADSLIPAGTTSDLNGNARVLYTAVDLGAYEFDTTGIIRNVVGFANSRIYINDSSSYSAIGVSWTSALSGNAGSCRYPGQTLLYEAMKDAAPGTEIWLRQGIYLPSLNGNRDHSFTVGSGVKVYGGFAGNEALLIQRDPANNRTIFSGNIGDTTTDTDNTYHILNINPANSVYADSALIDGITLENARTEGTDAAAVVIQAGSKIRLSRVLVAGDTLLSSGVGFLIKPGARVTLTDGTAERFSRGGIYNEGILRMSNFTVKSIHFSGIQNFDSLAMLNCNIDSNATLAHNPDATGGALRNSGYCSITGGNIRGNRSYFDAAGISNMLNAVMHITGCNISGNKCNTYGWASGGGILNGGILEIKKSTIKYNAADVAGGGICNSEGATCTISGTTIAYNQVNGAWVPVGGGGVLNEGNCHLERSLISNNETFGNGGGLYNPTSVKSCVVVNNKKGDPYKTGGGLFISDGCQGIFNSTIMNNAGEGISSQSADTFAIKNSVIYGNDQSFSGHFNISYSCVAGSLQTNHNTSHNPFCIDPTTGNGIYFDGLSANWHIWGCSPCVNTGNNAFLDAGDSLDAAGAPRVKWNVVDMGAMELQTDSISGDCPPGISHNIVWEIFTPRPDNIQTTTGAPDHSQFLEGLQTERSDDLSTLSRVRGYLLPSVTGYYRFYMASEPYSSFSLSSDSSDFNVRSVCSPNWGDSYYWPAILGNSDSLFLESNKHYYFEAFCVGYYWNNCCNPWIKTFVKGNYLKVGWVLPGTSNLQVIPWQNVRPAGPKQSPGVKWEIFKNRTGYEFDTLKITTEIPDEVRQLDSLVTIDNATSLDHFSSRIRGYLLPPETGDYTFYFACDNVGQFWLSTDTSATNAQLKSVITSAQPDWLQNTSIQTLTAGKRYYFEILHYDTVYTDLIKLGWRIPGGTGPEVIKAPFILNFGDQIPLQSFSLIDRKITAFPGWTVTPRYHITPWNGTNKTIHWKSSNMAIASVNADGIITMVSPGTCLIMAAMVENQLLADTLQLTVTNYYGPYFAKENAPENGDGRSWNSAIRLTTLLDILKNGELTQQVRIYIAAGTYKPTTTIDQNMTFLLNNTRIVGGFNATISGSDTTNRDVMAHETILSGEIGVPGETIDNCYHVVVTRGTSAIDGFTIRDGRASCSTHGWTPGFHYFKRDDNGGGIITEGQYTSITNCRITNNSAWNGGGGVFCNGSGMSPPVVTVQNCGFFSNRTQQQTITLGGIFTLVINGYGAGMWAGSSLVNVKGCDFYDNNAVGDGRAIFLSNSTANIENSSIYKNNGSHEDLKATSNSAFNLKNVSVDGSVVANLNSSLNLNCSTITGGGYIHDGINTVALDNSIWTGMSLSQIPEPNLVTVKYSILDSTLYGTSNTDIVAANLPAPTTWLDTLASNGGPTPTMRLKNIAGNPAKNHGNPAYLGATDQRGAIRSDTVSIGAYQWVRPTQIAISPKPIRLNPGDSATFRVHMMPLLVSDSSYTVAGTNNSIVSIIGSKIHAQSLGTAYIVAKSNDRGLADSCLITVTMTVQQRLDTGETAKHIVDSGIPLDSLYGKHFQGGLIFYLNTSTGDLMVAAPSDQSNGIIWGPDGNCSTAGALGAGLTNTNTIVSALGTGHYAAYICDTLTSGGYTDWCLPSIDELGLMRQNLFMHDIGGFASGQPCYWSSTWLCCDQASGYYFFNSWFPLCGLNWWWLEHVRAARTVCLNPPTVSNAGIDIVNHLDTIVTLSANPATVGTGIWSIANGTGGRFVNPAAYNTSFSGNAGTSYNLVWSITNFCGQVSRDTVNVSFIAPTLSCQIVYVTPAGSGAMDGCSWDNALDGNSEAGNGYTKLAQTMRWMATPGTQFWLAEGTYKACTDGNREKSFELKQSVRIYGSFEGTETDTAQRNIALHPTILSGDIGIQNDSTDNSRIILKTVSPPWTNYSLIDGADLEGGYNEAGSGSGIRNTGILVVRSCDFRNNYSTGEGTGIYNDGTLDVKECRFHHNIASNGGGIYTSSVNTFSIRPSTVIRNSVFDSNTASAGAAIFNNGLTNMISCKMIGNQSAGVVYNAILGSLSGDSVVIGPDNTRGIINQGNLLLKNSSVIGNFGTYWWNDDDAASMVNLGKATLLNCAIINHLGCALKNTDSLFLKSCRIDSTHSSGGAFVNSGYADMLNCSMSHDTAGTLIPGFYEGGSPGGVLNSGTLRMKGSIFKNNFSAGPGGGIGNTGNLWIDSSWFEKNNSGIMAAYSTGGWFWVVVVGAQFSGGAIHNSTGHAVITNTIFNNNMADYGGAVATMAGNVTLLNCKLVKNFSLISGAALFNHGRMDIRNSLYANNQSGGIKDVGGIIACGKGSKYQFNNCDIVNNKSTKFLVSGVDEYETYQFDLNQTPDTVLISNSIVWGNDTLINNPNSSLISTNYTCLQQIFPGTWNIHANPLFLNPTSGNDTSYNALAADWRLAACSPCINVGANSLCSDSLDLAGNARKYYGVDMGALETKYDSSVTSVWNNNTTTTTAVLSWSSRIRPCETIVFVKDTIDGQPMPIPGANYNANTVFGSGTGQEGWYCIYKGMDSTVMVTGLTRGTTYRAAVFNVVIDSIYDVPALLNFTTLSIAGQAFVANDTITNGKSVCFDALQTITVAGNGTTFKVNNGGSATLIAGEKIRVLPGASVAAGGYLNGYISPGGPWCQMPAMPAVISSSFKTAEDDDPGVIRKNGFRVYPNPTDGSFTVELLSDPGETPVAIRCYDLTGSLILEKEIVVGRKLGMTLTGWESGIYVVRVTGNGFTGYKKIIKTN